MDYVWTILKPWLLDKGVWVSGFMWALTLVNAKLHLGLNHDTLVTISTAVSTAVVGHLSHAKFLAKFGFNIVKETPNA